MAEKYQFLSPENKTGKVVADDSNIRKIVRKEIERQGPGAVLNHIDVSKVTDMSFLFAGLGFCGDISKWDMSRVKDISNMFIGGPGPTIFVVPDSITEIGECAFYGCSCLTSIEIPESVTKIGDDAFHGCTGLTQITIPNSVTEIGDNAFCGCTDLPSIEIPNSVKKMGTNSDAKLVLQRKQ